MTERSVALEPDLLTGADEVFIPLNLSCTPSSLDANSPSSFRSATSEISVKNVISSSLSNSMESAILATTDNHLCETNSDLTDLMISSLVMLTNDPHSCTTQTHKIDHNELIDVSAYISSKSNKHFVTESSISSNILETSLPSSIHYPEEVTSNFEQSLDENYAFQNGTDRNIHRSSSPLILVDEFVQPNITTASSLPLLGIGLEQHCSHLVENNTIRDNPLDTHTNENTFLTFGEDDLNALEEWNTSFSKTDRQSQDQLYPHLENTLNEKSLTNSNVPIMPILSSLNASDKTKGQVDAVLDFFHSSSTQLPSVHSIITSTTLLGDQFESPRPPAKVPEEHLEHLDKKTIFVLYKSSCTPVTWFTDLPISDVREMILCACDAIIDMGFVLREVVEISQNETDDETVLKMQLNNGLHTLRYRHGRRYEFEEFHQLVSGGTYTLQPATERLDLKQITGDRCRRLTIQIDPLLHVESIKGINAMRKGANLLKHTDIGFPHLRQFQLSSDCERLLWYSPENHNNTSIHIKSIREIRLGQKSPLFQRYKLPTLEHLSFSIFYDPFDTSPLSKSFSKLIPLFGKPEPWLNSLDITCKDEMEYDHWACGLKALVFNASKMCISKEQLLSHSRRFKDSLQETNVNMVSRNPQTSTSDPAAAAVVGLEECLELPVHTYSELEKKLRRLNTTLIKARTKINHFDAQYNPDGHLGTIQLTDDLCVTPTSIGENDQINKSPVSPFLLSPESPLTPNSNHGVFQNKSCARNPTSSTLVQPYTTVFNAVSDAEDDQLEYIRMQELINTIENLLSESVTQLSQVEQSINSRQESEDINPFNSPDMLKNINQLLWKAEVDLENVEDMLKRLIERRAQLNSHFLSRTIAEINTHVSDEFQKMSNALLEFFNVATDTFALNEKSCHNSFNS